MLIFDADGLIKLNRSGVLGLVTRNYGSLVPAAVYDEVVVRGALRGHADAADIGQILERFAEVTSPEIGDGGHELDHLVSGLGAGETQALYLALQLRQGAAIVSDDRRFLGVLSDLSISFLVPSHIILGLVRDELLSVPNSKIAMNAPRPFIRQSDYLEALEELGE